MSRVLLTLLLAGTAAGCTAPPKRIVVNSQVSPIYPTRAGDQAGRQASEIPWQALFGDARLRALIASAFQNNRDLRTATARIAEAAALRRITRADLLPTVEAGASIRASGGRGSAASRGGGGQSGGAPGQPGSNPDGGGTPANPPGSNGNGTGGNADNDGTGGSGGGGSAGGGTGFQLEVGVSAFELDFWGRVRSLDAAALAQYLATVEARDAFQLSLIAEVADAYLLGRELDLRARLARETIALRERGVYLARRLRDEGEGSELEVSEERILLADARAALADVERQRALADNLLQLLVGAPPAPGLPPPLPLDAQGIVEDVAPGLPSDLLLRRPDIREAEQQLRATNANVAAARAALLPRIALTGAAGLASPDLESLFSPGAFFWDLAADLLQPIFDSGRRRAQLAVERARQEVAVAAYERAIQNAFREVADALAERRFLQEQLVALREGLDAQNRRLRLAQLRFDAGEAAIVDLLEARRQVFQSQQALATLRRTQLANAVQLYVALGGANQR